MPLSFKFGNLSGVSAPNDFVEGPASASFFLRFPPEAFVGSGEPSLFRLAEIGVTRFQRFWDGLGDVDKDGEWTNAAKEEPTVGGIAVLAVATATDDAAIVRPIADEAFIVIKSGAYLDSAIVAFLFSFFVASLNTLTI